MTMAKVKKKVKVIKIDTDKCNGCRSCEVICSAFHATDKYSIINPSRARIRLIRDPLRDVYLPVYAGEYTPAECMGRDKYVVDGKEYEECAFCRASCPPGMFSKSLTRVFRLNATFVKTIRNRRSLSVLNGVCLMP